MREYTFGSGGLSITAAPATTIAWVNPSAAPNMNIEILRMWLSQSANATSAQQHIQGETQSSGFPLLAPSAPKALKRADPNASVLTTISAGAAGAAGTTGINASSETAGGKTVIFDDNFNVLNGWLNVPTPPETIILPAGYLQGFGLFWVTAPATLTSWSVGLTFREM